MKGKAQGEYEVARIYGDIVISSGMTPRSENGELLSTHLCGSQCLTTGQASDLAFLAAKRAVDVCSDIIPSYSSLTEAISVTVYIAAVSGFTDHSRVADGASRAIQDALGAGGFVRAAVGVCSLPGGAPVEVQVAFAWQHNDR